MAITKKVVGFISFHELLDMIHVNPKLQVQQKSALWSLNVLALKAISAQGK